jgi:hypothetical protein
MTEHRHFRSRPAASVNQGIDHSIADMGVSANSRLKYTLQGHNAEYRVQHGLYLGVVKQNVSETDKSARGVIRCWIPNFSKTDVNNTDFKPGSDEEDDTPTTQRPIKSSDVSFSDEAANWFTCYPLYPFASNSNSGDGYGSAGGFEYTPTVGSTVGIMFALGDTSSAFWFGVSPQLTNNSRPSMPSVDVDPEETYGRKKSNVPGGTGPGSPEDYKPVTTLSKNIVDAGIGDDTRGATPVSDSLIFAVSSHGGGKTKDGKIIVGHQLIFDDRSDHRIARLRSSEGAQIMFNDTARLIYMNTQTGKVWFELRDDGIVYLYADKDISINAERDITIRAGRDFITNVGRDQITKVEEDVTFTIGQNYDLNVGKTLYIRTVENLEMASGEKFRFASAENIETIALGEYLMYGKERLDIGSLGIIRIDSNDPGGVKIQGEAAEDPGEAPDIKNGERS